MKDSLKKLQPILCGRCHDRICDQIVSLNTTNKFRLMIVTRWKQISRYHEYVDHGRHAAGAITPTGLLSVFDIILTLQNCDGLSP